MRLAFILLLASAPAGFSQVDFTGEWAPAYHEDAPERLPGPELGDYLGIPINDAARLRADSYDADRISVVTEFQCRPHSAPYQWRALGSAQRQSPAWQEGVHAALAQAAAAQGRLTAAEAEVVMRQSMIVEHADTIRAHVGGRIHERPELDRAAGGAFHEARRW